jgi:uncharacterized protein (DUF58 family)
MAATRNQDVLIVIDNAEGSHDVAAAVFDRSARAAVTLAREHLTVGDRVALAISSPDLFCQRLGSGRRHLIRVVDTIMDARRLPGFVKPRLDLLPRSVLTPGALVIVLAVAGGGLDRVDRQPAPPRARPGRDRSARSSPDRDRRCTVAPCGCQLERKPPGTSSASAIVVLCGRPASRLPVC